MCGVLVSCGVHVVGVGCRVVCRGVDFIKTVAFLCAVPLYTVITLSNGPRQKKVAKIFTQFCREVAPSISLTPFLCRYTEDLCENGDLQSLDMLLRGKTAYNFGNIFGEDHYLDSP